MSATLPAPRVSSGTADASETPFWSVPDLAGEEYRTVLHRFHHILSPKTYLEIGVENGHTLELCSCASIGIDPEFRIDKLNLNNKDVCCLFRMTSDQFFKTYDPSVLLKQPIDMAFLDGMHLFEFLLRDFINVEKYCKPNSVILMHDCVPTDEHVARRHRNDNTFERLSGHAGWWAGDVWKTVAILLKARPDLRVLALNAPGTGLVAVTRLDPSSTVLSDRYYDLVAEYRDKSLPKDGDAYFASIKLADTRQFASFEALSGMFWL